uniref:Uncharacterized protein n=1 Tax=Anopheles culicifacies TaxID=139723 RepID=A0A182MRL8_9DIPT
MIGGPRTPPCDDVLTGETCTGLDFPTQICPGTFHVPYSADAETALLLPAALSKSRHENDTSDIRRNLRLRYKNAFKHNRGNEISINNPQPNRTPITCECAFGKPVTRVLNVRIGALLAHGHEVVALKGWNVPPCCRIWYRAVYISSSAVAASRRASKSRDHVSYYVYCVEFEVIKATKACHKDNTYRGLAEGERVIVRCDLEALHEDKTVDTLSSNSVQDDEEPDTPKYRCRGDGLTGRNTRFTTLAMPACRGKWMRLTVGQPKKCPSSDAQFIFV